MELVTVELTSNKQLLKKHKRQKQVRLAVKAGLIRWANNHHPLIAFPNDAEGRYSSGTGIMTGLPRREFITTETTTDVSLPMMRDDTFPTKRSKAVGRLFIWFKASFSLVVGIGWDRLRRRDSTASRAVRLRRTFDKTGGTFVNIGQLLAMRVDLLPWALCVELSKLRDQMPPFPVEQAIKSIEMNTGKSLNEIFHQFDPEPILSTSAACVYQAFLVDGEKVAVKVRRPGIGELNMADLKVLDWVLSTLEFLSILRTGLTRDLRQDFRESITNELNFLSEARFQSLYRREAKKSGKGFITSPRIYFEICSQDVIVEKFVSGMWLWELTAAVNQNDEEMLAVARRMGIDPKVVAQRLMWANFWEMEEQLFFLTNPHPDNVIVSPNNKLTFLDFSSVGSINAENRQAIQQLLQYAWKRDPLSMAQVSLILLEPLPPIDVIGFTKALEERYWQFLYGLESKHTEWWERTSARLWVGFVEIAREHGITISPEVLRIIRASLLHDTLAARLHPKIDRVKEYHKFSKFRARQARKQVEKRLDNLFSLGMDSRFFSQLENITDTGDHLFQQLRRFLSIPTFKFNAIIGKYVYASLRVLNLVGQWIVVTAVALGFVYGLEWILLEQAIDINDTLSRVGTNRFYQFVVLLLVVVNFRAILIRLNDKEV
jgi:predicted unusual protein kinase regulating ubiquinone biosynthesis (AarF/ABC1/UbiB family)